PIARRDDALEVLQEHPVEGEIEHVTPAVGAQAHVRQPGPTVLRQRVGALVHRRLQPDVAARVGPELGVVAPAVLADGLADDRAERLRMLLEPAPDRLLGSSWGHARMLESRSPSAEAPWRPALPSTSSSTPSRRSSERSPRSSSVKK